MQCEKNYFLIYTFFSGLVTFLGIKHKLTKLIYFPLSYHVSPSTYWIDLHKMIKSPCENTLLMCPLHQQDVKHRRSNLISLTTPSPSTEAYHSLLTGPGLKPRFRGKFSCQDFYPLKINYMW